LHSGYDELDVTRFATDEPLDLIACFDELID